MNWNVLTKGICIYNIFYEKKILSSTFRNNETTSTFLSSFYAITHRLRNTFKKEFEKIPIRIVKFKSTLDITSIICLKQ